MKQDDDEIKKAKVNVRSSEKNHYIGHRNRLKKRIVSNSESVLDYELIEAMLFWAIPRKDVKPLAKSLLETFGSIPNLIYAEQDKLCAIKDLSDNMYANIVVVKEIIKRIHSQSVAKQNILTSWNQLIDYLKVTISYQAVEQFRILFLNKKNILIADEMQSQGTIDQSAVYPREIVRKAIFHSASAIILVHNHPSGNPEPSKSDIEITNRIVQACQSIGVTVHDHVIVARGKFYSFKSNYLI